MLSGFQVEVTKVLLTQGLEQTITGRYEFAIVDVGPNQLSMVLVSLRGKPECAEVPILVEITRVAEAAHLAGVLPRYRAMPVNRTELAALVRRRLTTLSKHYEVARIL